MPTIVGECPRCKSHHTTFNVTAHVYKGARFNGDHTYEIFSVCRACHSPSILDVVQSYRAEDASRLFRRPEHAAEIFQVDMSLNDIFDITGHISLKDEISIKCPEHTPEHLKVVFEEGAACFAISCYNASVAMFRLCLDLDTKEIAEKHDISGMLFARLQKLFSQSLLPSDLEELSHCIRENGNDGAHDGTVTEVEAQDILDFTVSYFESRYTLPERIRLRREARNKRHEQS
ncbi:DUF4145 domain-containing protein [Alteromonas sp. NFXS44]|uniref:DUF4145 domain-containing protein n=1 Tax=Alteromonas sp. NFXS44 TaxID=2818435 RepID=UPI0032E00F9A